MTVEWPLPSLLPHSGTMVLIGDPVESGDGWAESSVRIGEDSMFFKSGSGVPSWVGAEYMAQTIALYAGIGARKAGDEIKIGLLIGSRRYNTMTPYFTLGQSLRIRVSEIWEDEQMAVFDCRIDAEARLVEAQLNVFRPVDPERFLTESRA
jgi:predicted hotdog family 3-hydroxylacyl-ACP dehydratase